MTDEKVTYRGEAFPSIFTRNTFTNRSLGYILKCLRRISSVHPGVDVVKYASELLASVRERDFFSPLAHLH